MRRRIAKDPEESFKKFCLRRRNISCTQSLGVYLGSIITAIETEYQIVVMKLSAFIAAVY